MYINGKKTRFRRRRRRRQKNADYGLLKKKKKTLTKLSKVVAERKGTVVDAY